MKNGNVIQLLVEGFEGEAVNRQVNKTFTKTYQYVNAKELAIHHLDQRADVCLAITDCAIIMFVQ